MLNVYDFVGGALMMGYLVLGLFFLKFWQRTRDSLFVMFAFAFWLLAGNVLAVSATEGVDLDVGWTYLLRLLAFVLIIVAIIRKNTRVENAAVSGRRSLSPAKDIGRSRRFAPVPACRNPTSCRARDCTASWRAHWPKRFAARLRCARP